MQAQAFYGPLGSATASMMPVMPRSGAQTTSATLVAHQEAMLRVSKATKKTLDLFEEGVYLGALT